MRFVGLKRAEITKRQSHQCRSDQARASRCVLAAWRLSAIALVGVFVLCPVLALVGTPLGCLNPVG